MCIFTNIFTFMSFNRNGIKEYFVSTFSDTLLLYFKDNRCNYENIYKDVLKSTKGSQKSSTKFN